MAEEDCQPTPVEGKSCLPSGTAWSPRRHELLEWFQEHAPSLADPYRGAVQLLAVPDFPGRIHFIAHAVRDICNRLPDFLGSVQRDRLNYEEEVSVIAKEWPLQTRVSPGAYSSGDAPPADSVSVPIPMPAVRAVENLLLKYEARQTNQDVIAGMFALVAQADDTERQNLVPIVEEFRRTARWFMERAHVRTKTMEAPKEADLARQFEQFEQVTLSLIRGFFRTADELNELLQEANARAD